jgi:hypothetical protein
MCQPEGENEGLHAKVGRKRNPDPTGKKSTTRRGPRLNGPQAQSLPWSTGKGLRTMDNTVPVWDFSGDLTGGSSSVTYRDVSLVSPEVSPTYPITGEEDDQSIATFDTRKQEVLSPI